MCQNKHCDSERVWYTSLKVADGFYLRYEDGSVYRGYVPKGVGIDCGNDDYVQFKYCADCLQIQAQGPLEKPGKEEEEEY